MNDRPFMCFSGVLKSRIPFVVRFHTPDQAERTKDPKTNTYRESDTLLKLKSHIVID